MAINFRVKLAQKGKEKRVKLAQIGQKNVQKQGLNHGVLQMQVKMSTSTTRPTTLCEVLVL